MDEEIRNLLEGLYEYFNGKPMLTTEEECSLAWIEKLLNRDGGPNDDRSDEPDS